MTAKIDEWQRLVKLHFGFLEDYGFRIEERLESSTAWVTRVVYVAHDRAVEVAKSVEFNRAEVSLIRLDARAADMDHQRLTQHCPVGQRSQSKSTRSNR